MTIGEKITALLESRGVKQAFIAAQFRERALLRGREFAQDTIESHISRLKKDDPGAVRFFFADVADGHTVLELLEVPEDERPTYLCEANTLLTPEDKPLLVVVDLSDSVQGKALVDVCEELANKVVLAIPARVALVVTESQRLDLLPRCTPEGRVLVEVVANAKVGWSRTQKLAAEGAVVVSGRRFDPLSRWVAIEARDQHLVLEPADGLARCAAGKPVEDHDAGAALRQLDALHGDVPGADPPPTIGKTPCERRALLAKLVRGQPVQIGLSAYGRKEVSADAITRLAWGRALGVPVAATAEEWGESLVTRAKAIGVAVVATGGANDVTSHRARVARGGEAPRAILVGAELHVINASTELRSQLQGRHGVQFHDETQRESRFQRIEKLVQTTAWEAWLDDPFMDAALGRIDPDGRDRDELEFARASLLLHGKLRPAVASSDKDWRAKLGEILKNEPPPVGVRVPTSSMNRHRSTVSLLPENEVARRASQRGAELHGVPALAPPRITRDTTLCALHRSSDWYGDFDTYQRERLVARRRFLLPKEHVMSDFDSLFVLLDSSPAKVGYSDDHWKQWTHNDSRHLLGLEWKQESLPTDVRFWDDADEMLGALWIALRRAVRRGDGATLHDGTGMLEMGGGIVALIKASSSRNVVDEQVEADFWRSPRLGHSSEKPPRATASLAREIGVRAVQTGGYCSRVMAEVPTQLFLAQGVVRATVTFRVTPWETYRERSMPAEFAAAVGGALHAVDDAQRDDGE